MIFFFKEYEYQKLLDQKVNETKSLRKEIEVDLSYKKHTFFKIKKQNFYSFTKENSRPTFQNPCKTTQESRKIPNLRENLNRFLWKAMGELIEKSKMLMKSLN